MQVPFVRQVLRRRQREPRRDDALDRGILRQVEEQRRPLHRPALLEVGAEEAGRLHFQPHGPEDDGKVLFVGAINLDGHLILGEAGGGEGGDLLAACGGVHGVKGAV